MTEAGFASDLGAEKFFDIKCRVGGLTPSAAVIVATVRALKMHGGVARDALGKEDVAAVERGLANLEKHVENVRQFGVPAVVALNHFTADTDAEVNTVMDACARLGVPARLSRVWADGGAGGAEVAKALLDVMEGTSKFSVLYPDEAPLEKKIETIATRLYGANGVTVLPAAATKLKRFAELGYGQLPVCMAKTQNSLSDDARKLGRPRDFTVTIRDAKVAAGAGLRRGVRGRHPHDAGAAEGAGGRGDRPRRAGQRRGIVLTWGARDGPPNPPTPAGGREVRPPASAVACCSACPTSARGVTRR